MVALTAERNTRLRIGDRRAERMAATVKIWGGSLVMRNAAGYLTQRATATDCVGVGRAEKTADHNGAAARPRSSIAPAPSSSPARPRVT